MTQDDKIYNQCMRLERGIAFLNKAAKEFDLGNLQIECWELDMIIEKRENQRNQIIALNYPLVTKGK